MGELRSMSAQNTYLAPETVPGTAGTAFVGVPGLRMKPGWDGDRDTFRGGGGKVVTTTLGTDEVSPWDTEVAACFNHVGFPLASRFNKPTTTTPGGATLARQHVFAISPSAEDLARFYTAVWGDSTVALQGVYGYFNNFVLDISRGEVSIDSGFRSRAASTGASLPAGPPADTKLAPMPSNMWDVFIDPTWAALGTTKYGGAYSAKLDFGEKYDEDSPINSTIVSYEQPIEKAEQDDTFELMLRLGATAVSQFANLAAGTKQFFRLKLSTANGPSPYYIEAAIPYSCQFDFCAEIVSRGAIDTAPNSSAVVAPLSLVLTKDPTTGNYAAAQLVNTVTAY